jgi:AGCS family alanine or glycine:cation symporter
MQRALFSNEAGQGSAPIAHSAAKTDEPVREGAVAGLEPFIDTICVCTITALVILLSGMWNRDPALVWADGAPPAITQAAEANGKTTWQIADAPVQIRDESEASNQMRSGTAVFLVVSGGKNATTGGDHHQVNGTLQGSADEGWHVSFVPLTLESEPQIARDGVYFGFKGATLTAKAYDRVFPGLGLWIVPLTAFLFAFSTMISWSYYGEQGVTYLFGPKSVTPYRIVYCLLILVASAGLIRTENELDVLSTLGTGVMLWVNIPIMLIFGPMAMKAYHEYMGRLKRGELHPHAAPRLTDVVEGKDVE